MSDQGMSGTVFEGDLRETQESHRGSVDVRTGKGHQIYPDGHVFTRDPLSEDHWKNVNYPKGDPDRLGPPPDLR